MNISKLGIKALLLLFVVKINLDAKTYKRIEFNFNQQIEFNNEIPIPANQQHGFQKVWLP